MTDLGRAILDPVRDLRVPVPVAKWPLFALSPGQTSLAFEGQQRGRRTFLHLRAKDAALGLATIADVDIIAWATSAYMKMADGGRTLPDMLETRASELLQFCGRSAGGRQHTLLTASLDRLANTSVTTNINPDTGTDVFHWIEDWSAPSSGRGALQIRFAPWLRTIIEHRHILRISPELFRLRGLRRRLYLWAAAHAGSDTHDRYTLQLAQAHHKSGSSDVIRRFCYELRPIVVENEVPGCNLAVELRDGFEHLVITRTAKNVGNKAVAPSDNEFTSHVSIQPTVISFPELPDDPSDTQTPQQVSFPECDGLDRQLGTNATSTSDATAPNQNTPLTKRTQRLSNG